MRKGEKDPDNEFAVIAVFSFSFLAHCYFNFKGFDILLVNIGTFELLQGMYSMYAFSGPDGRF